ncbi:MAG: LacI family DNA-binding transcriptional regulator [Spirochaetes bacterium]|nr:LacI family DNA-binding transcriptional regulator [Spirochaetota bacterium]
MANQRDVAKEAGVSSASVSRYLNNQNLVRSDTAKRIKKAIKKLNYRADYSAMSLKTGKFFRIGIIVPSNGPFYWQILSEIEKILSAAGYFTNVYFVRKINIGGNYHNFNFSLINNRQVDGFILFPLMRDTDNEIISRLLTVNEKFVVIDREFENKAINQVVVDNYRCGTTAAELLINSGCRKPLFIWGFKDMWSSQMRYNGFRETFNNAGILFDETREISGEFNAEYTYDYVKTQFSAIPAFDCVFASNDFSAMGFMKAASEHGLSAGKDYKIIGFDNCETSPFFDTPLTTFSQPLNEIGEIAAKMLLDLLGNRVLKENKILLQGSLIKRDTA